MSTGINGFAHRFEAARVPDAPTLLLLHGTGGDENDLLELGGALDDKAALLSPRGRVVEQGANRWFRRLREGVFDADDLLTRTDQLAEFVLSAVDHYRLEPSHLVAVGFPTAPTSPPRCCCGVPNLLRAAVLFAPMVPLDDPPRVDLSRTGAFLAAGRTDPIARPEQAERLAEQLIERGAAVEVRWHPDGHGMDRRTLDQPATWLSKIRAATSTDPLP